jgi:glyoxylase-like metal-dependent hydrolase (beta-lactamase superfamily II)
MRPLASANFWLIVGETSALLIDAGIGVSPLAPIVRALTDLPVRLLVTQAHYDHMGGAHEFADRLAHPEEASVLATPTARATLWEGWLTEESFLRFPGADFDFAGYRVTPAPATHAITDGEILDLGGRSLEILHTPGHSPGLVCAYERSTRTLFSSDALYDGDMFFDLPGSNRRHARNSISRLQRLAPAVVHPGHFESFRDEDMNFVAASALRLADG